MPWAYPVPSEHRWEHSSCYGMGCFACEGRGWIESDEWREAREDAEDRAADEARERRRLGGDD